MSNLWSDFQTTGALNGTYWPLPVGASHRAYTTDWADAVLAGISQTYAPINGNQQPYTNLGQLTVLTSGAATVLKADGATSRVGILTASPVCSLDVHCTAGGQSFNSTDGVNSTLTISHGSSPLPNSVIVGALGSAAIVFENNASVSFALLSGNDIYTPNLRSTNPGAGSKRWWYDPADSNRIKFAA